MALIDSLFSRRAPVVTQERAGLVDMFESWAGAKPKEKIEDDFRSYTTSGYKGNTVLFSVIQARMSLFSEVRFTWRNKKTDELFGNADLAILENPWTNGTTGELLARMEQDVSLAGNSYTYRASSSELQRWRPDWVEILSDRQQVIGYIYTPGGPNQTADSVFALPEEVAHWSPIPDPMAAFRGMSWVTPILMELTSDVAMTRHKQMFFERAATPNMIVKLVNKLDDASRRQLRDELSLRHEGMDNAYRTMILDSGSDAMVVGSGMQAISFDTLQAAGENRIAAAGNTPGIVVGLKEGLQAATYSNYQQAMRRFVDIFGRPQWRSACAALQSILTPPAGAQLWYDASDIAALHESEKDQADILLKKSEAVVNLVRSGYAGAYVAKVVETGEGFESMPHTGEIYFPGAQAYTAPGETPGGVEGDVPPKKDTGTPATAAPLRALKIVHDGHGFVDRIEEVEEVDSDAG